MGIHYSILSMLCTFNVFHNKILGNILKHLYQSGGRQDGTSLIADSLLFPVILKIFLKSEGTFLNELSGGCR